MGFVIFICFVQSQYFSVLAKSLIPHLETDYIKKIDVDSIRSEYNRMFDSMVTMSVVEDSAEVRALSNILGKLDPHSHILDPSVMKGLQGGSEDSTVSIGLSIIKDSIGILITQVLQDGSAYETDIKGGDYILSIDDRSALDCTAIDIIGLLRGMDGSTVRVNILKSNRRDTLNYLLTRRKIRYHTLSKYYVLEGNIGYIHSMTFDRTSFDEMYAIVDSFKKVGVNKLILDLRYNMGGLLTITEDIISLFLAKGREILSLKNYRDKKVEHHKSNKKYLYYQNMPLIILVNKHSGGGAEIVAGALQDWDRALIMGEKTYGLGVIQNVFLLDLGYFVNLVIKQVILPSGRTFDGFFDNPNKKNTGYETKIKKRIVVNGPITPDIILPHQDEIQIIDHPNEDPWVIKALDILKQIKRTEDFFKSNE